MVWGDYGRMERKVLMGAAEVYLPSLKLDNMVIGWYKLFPRSALVNHHQGAPITNSGNRRNSGSSLESLYQSGSTEGNKS